MPLPRFSVRLSQYPSHHPNHHRRRHHHRYHHCRNHHHNRLIIIIVIVVIIVIEIIIIVVITIVIFIVVVIIFALSSSSSSLSLLSLLKSSPKATTSSYLSTSLCDNHDFRSFFLLMASILLLWFPNHALGSYIILCNCKPEVHRVSGNGCLLKSQSQKITLDTRKGHEGAGIEDDLDEDQHLKPVWSIVKYWRRILLDGHCESGIILSQLRMTM